MQADRKLDQKRIDDITQAIRLGATYELACKYAGIDYATFKRWRNAAEAGQRGLVQNFAAAVRKAEGDAGVKWLAIIEQAAAKEWTAAAWKLERRYPEDYGRRAASSDPADVGALARALRQAQEQIDASVADEPESID